MCKFDNYTITNSETGKGIDEYNNSLNMKWKETSTLANRESELWELEVVPA